VVLGPLLLAAVAPLERVTGVPRLTLAALLLPFTLYGGVIVAGTQKRTTPVPTWLVPLAVAVHTGAVVIGSVGVTRRGLTRVGRLAGGGLAVGGVRVLLALRRPLT
jgi:hypothetical protein